VWLIWAERKDKVDLASFRRDPAVYIAKASDTGHGKLAAARRMVWEHSWLAAFASTPYGPLSRSAIISCLVISTVSSLWSNAMFYSSAPRSPIEALILGVVSALIALPGPLCFRFLFRRVRRIAHSTVTTSPSSPPPRLSGVVPNVTSTSSDDKLPKWTRDAVGIVAAQRAAKLWRAKTAKKTFFQKDSSWGRMQNTVALQLEHWAQRLVFGMAMLYVGYITYLLLLYTLTFPDDIAMNWVVASLVSLAQTIVVNEPGRVLLIHLVVALLHRRREGRRKTRVETMQSKPPMSPTVPSAGEATEAEEGWPLAVGTLLTRGAALRKWPPASQGPEPENVDFIAVRQGHLVVETARRTEAWSFQVVHLAPGQPPQHDDATLGHGVLWMLGSDGGARDYTPPTTDPMHPERWTVRLSSSDPDATTSTLAASLLQRPPQRRHTPLRGATEEEAVWVSVDIGEGVAVWATHYSLTHGGVTLDDALTTWELQGSLDGVTWNTLDARRDETPFAHPSRIATFKVGKPVACRQLRIVQTRPNLSGRSLLSLGGFEVFGTVSAVFSAPRFSALMKMSQLWDLPVDPPSYLPLAESTQITILPPLTLLTVDQANVSAGTAPPGVIHCLATKNKTLPWRHPIESEIVSVRVEPPSPFGSLWPPPGRRGVTLTSSDRCSLTVTLLQGPAVAPSRLWLSLADAVEPSYLVDWRVSGSLDGQEWEQMLLDTRVSTSRVAVWRRHHNRSTAWRHVRIEPDSDSDTTSPSTISVVSLELSGLLILGGPLVVLEDGSLTTTSRLSFSVALPNQTEWPQIAAGAAQTNLPMGLAGALEAVWTDAAQDVEAGHVSPMFGPQTRAIAPTPATPDNRDRDPDRARDRDRDMNISTSGSVLSIGLSPTDADETYSHRIIDDQDLVAFMAELNDVDRAIASPQSVFHFDKSGAGVTSPHLESSPRQQDHQDTDEQLAADLEAFIGELHDADRAMASGGSELGQGEALDITGRDERATMEVDNDDLEAFIGQLSQAEREMASPHSAGVAAPDVDEAALAAFISQLSEEAQREDNESGKASGLRSMFG